MKRTGPGANGWTLRCRNMADTLILQPAGMLQQARLLDLQTRLLIVDDDPGIRELSNALGGKYAVLTSQFCMPSALCTTLYADTTVYPSSATNFAKVSLSSDNVFGDNTSAQISQQTPAFTAAATGYTATALIGIAR